MQREVTEVCFCNQEAGDCVFFIHTKTVNSDGVYRLCVVGQTIITGCYSQRYILALLDGAMVDVMA